VKRALCHVLLACRVTRDVRVESSATLTRATFAACGRSAPDRIYVYVNITYIYKYVYIYICIHIYIYVYIYVCIYIYMYTYIHIYIHINIYVLHVYVYIYTHTCTYYLHIYVRVCICIIYIDIVYHVLCSLSLRAKSNLKPGKVAARFQACPLEPTLARAIWSCLRESDRVLESCIVCFVCQRC